jgi:hypothetical protein
MGQNISCKGPSRLRKKPRFCSYGVIRYKELETEVSMRGGEVRSGSLFSYVDLEARVRRGHPAA